MTRRAFTLVEILTVIAILVTLMALLFPVFAKSKDAAYETKCISNLHQTYIALELYRQNENGKEVGNPDEMGLPITDWYVRNPILQFGLDCRGPIARTHLLTGPVPQYPSVAEEKYRLRSGVSWAQYVGAYGDKSILFFDGAHNPPDFLDYYDNAYLGLGVNMGGSLVRRRHQIKVQTDLLDPIWWHDDFNSVFKDRLR